MKYAMQRGSTLFMRIVVWAIGAVILALCIFALPVGIRSENAEAYRPIFLGMYVSALPFFLAVYQALKLLKYIDENKAFSELSVSALGTIKYCAITISALYVLGMPYLYMVADQDDAPGVILIGLVIIFASIVIATFVAVLQKLLKNAIDLKSENDLTV